jgi:hypothetical protein
LAASKLERSKNDGQAFKCLVCMQTFGATNKKAILLQVRPCRTWLVVSAT